MGLSEFTVTIPGWLTLLLAGALILHSILLIQLYLDMADPHPPFTIDLPFVAGDSQEDDE